MIAGACGEGNHAGELKQDDGFSVIVPVYNEAAVLPGFAQCIRDGLPQNGVEVVFACNGCADASAELLRSIDDPRFTVLVLAEACKALAIRAAEEVATRFPRFYVDSDVLIEGASLVKLAAALKDEGAELVSPRIVYDEAEMSFAAKRIHRVWHSLPHVVDDGHHYVLGVSREGRSRWGVFPDLLADDAFIQSRIPPSRRKIVPEVTVTTRPARTFWSFVCIRERWLRGARELHRSGIELPRSQGQCRNLLRLAARGQVLNIAVYLVARTMASAKSAMRGSAMPSWYHDRTSRR